MSDDQGIWNVYWENRLREMETLGKREAILAGSRLVRERAAQGLPARLLELGCGEGQIIGALMTAHQDERGVRDSVGVDYSPAAVARCRRDYPRGRFIEGDFTDPALLQPLGQFDILLLVNALHEVFSSTYSVELGEVHVAEAKTRVARALASAVGMLSPGGLLVLFDGLEPPGDPLDRLTIRFLHPEAAERFEQFASEYVPFQVQYRMLNGYHRVELSRRDFTRYIDKSIFLGKRLWETEKLESYQYFTEAEFRSALERLGLDLIELRIFTVNEEKWRSTVIIETPGESFPAEHILIIAQKRPQQEQ